MQVKLIHLKCMKIDKITAEQMKMGLSVYSNLKVGTDPTQPAEELKIK